MGGTTKMGGTLRIIWTLAVCGAALLRVELVSAQCVLPEDRRLPTPSLSIFDFTGQSVAIDGDVAAIGAPYHRGGGAVFVYHYQGTRWALKQTLVASDAQHAANFGRSVAVRGDALAVGAARDDAGQTDSGSAYVFRRQSGVWSEEAKLVPSDPSMEKNFGSSICLDGDLVVVGAIRDAARAVDAGAAYVFSRSGTNWNQDQKLTASDAAFETQFGASIALEGTLLVVGAFLRDSSGAVYFFRRQSGTFNQLQRVRAADAAFGDLFGSSVALSMPWMAVGAELEDSGGSESGAAYFFVFQNNRWQQRDKVVASDSSSADFFGKSVDIDADLAVVGAWGNSTYGSSAGAAFQFRRVGNRWIEQQKLLPTDGRTASFFGAAVGISDHRIIAGAYFDFPGGAAYSFTVGDFGFTLTPDDVVLGDLVRLWYCGGVPGMPVVTIVTAVDGISTFSRIPITSYFDATGVLIHTSRIMKVPPGLPANIELLSLSVGADGSLWKSNEEVIRIR
jgi:hypothetical protein